MEARYRLTRRTLDDYGSSQAVSHLLARIPDGTHWTTMPATITVGDWLSAVCIGDEFTISIAATASHSAKTPK
jgi:hypothetical protein